MNTKANSSEGSWLQLNDRRPARTGMLLLLLLLTLSAAVQAHFLYVANNGTITITSYTGQGGAVTIPSVITGLPVTSIGDVTFQNCTSLTSVTIPNSVTTIGEGAFGGCSSLTDVTIPNSVTDIGVGAFCYCSSLTNVTIGDSVTSIGDDAFNACCSLTKVTIPNGVTSIGFQAFASCTSLISATIGDSVTSIGGRAFVLCSDLKRVTIPNSVTRIGEEVFGFCTSLTDVTIGDSVISIGDAAFMRCGLTDIMIPNSVTTIGTAAFASCPRLASVTIPNRVTSIGIDAFAGCTSLISITIPNSVTDIGDDAFNFCYSLTKVTIGNTVTRLGEEMFYECFSLTGVYFQGNAPSLGPSVFYGDNNATVYYLLGTTGWGTTYGGRPTAVWWIPPTIQGSPLSQTAEAGYTVDLGVKVSGPSPFCLWYFNYTNLISCSPNPELRLTNVQFSQSGAYTAVITNAAGAITSAPATLSVIAEVGRRPVPGVKATGKAGSSLNVDYAGHLSPEPTWLPLDVVTLTSTSQYWFDLTLPPPPQRFYRVWQTGTPGVVPSLDLYMVPAITLTGSIGGSVRVDAINQFGPIDAWVTLDTVQLTNASQLYFDTSSIGQPARLYRLVPSP